MIIIYKHPHGVTLNPKEYLLDNDDEVLRFKSEEEARKHLSDNGINDAEAFGIHFEVEEE